MKRRFAILLVAAMAAAAILSVGRAAPPAPAAAPVEITILHMNDAHGALEPYMDKGKSVGGYARLAALVHDARAASKAARVFLVDGGDDFTTKVKGDPVPRVKQGAGTVAIMNHLKLDVWTPGNHEFDNGLDVFKARMGESTAAVLTTNLLVKATGRALGKPYVIEKAGPVRVAFVGLCRQLQQMNALQLDDPAETLNRVLPDLRKQADVVVVVSHLGLKADEQLAQSVAGIDLLVGAHSHTVLPRGERVKDPDGKDVLIVQTGIQLQYLGRVDLRLAPANGGYQVAEANASLIAIDDSVKPDPKVAAMVEKAVKESPPPPPQPAPGAKPVSPTAAPASTAAPAPAAAP